MTFSGWSRNGRTRGCRRLKEKHCLKGGSQMEVEDAEDLEDAGGILMAAVVGGNDEFALRAVEVTAGVGHEAVAADGRVEFGVGFAAVADDAVIGDAGAEG